RLRDRAKKNSNVADQVYILGYISQAMPNNVSLTGLDFTSDSRPVLTRDDRPMFTTHSRPVFTT
ncbi:MAG: hypothetical protein ABFD51_12795, partial [Anaerolineaceae bacterium]